MTSLSNVDKNVKQFDENSQLFFPGAGVWVQVGGGYNRGMVRARWIGVWIVGVAAVVVAFILGSRFAPPASSGLNPVSPGPASKAGEGLEGIVQGLRRIPQAGSGGTEVIEVDIRIRNTAKVPIRCPDPEDFLVRFDDYSEVAMHLMSWPDKMGEDRLIQPGEAIGAELRSSFVASPAGKPLRMELRDENSGKSWELPLPKP